MKSFNILIFVISIVFLIACSKDNMADLNKSKIQTPSTENCDTANVSFSGKIIPIMESKCGSKNSSCHTQSASSGGVYLDSYDGVKNSIAKQLLPSIKWESSASRMPKGGQKLDNCSIAVISNWINQGTKNN